MLKPVRLLARQESLRLLRSPGPYLLLGLIWVETAMTARSFSQYAAQNRVVVVTQPLGIAVALAAISIALYVGLVATLSIVKEREVGSLEALFTAPIRPLDLINGYALAYAGVGAALLVTGMSFVLLIGSLAGVGMSPVLGLQAAAAMVAVAEVVALGLLLSAGARRVRTAVLALLGGLLILGSLYLGETLLAAQAEPETWASYGQALLAALMQALQFISPVATFTQVTGAATGGQMIAALLWLGAGLLRMVAWLTGARSLLRLVGVRP